MTHPQILDYAENAYCAKKFYCTNADANVMKHFIIQLNLIVPTQRCCFYSQMSDLAENALTIKQFYCANADVNFMTLFIIQPNLTVPTQRLFLLSNVRLG